MRKFLAVVKHEYRKVVFKWTFLIGTFLFPVIGAGFALVPALIFSLKGEPTRLVIVDSSGKIAPRIKQNLSAEQIEARAEQAVKESGRTIEMSQEDKMKRGSQGVAEGFIFVNYDTTGRSPDQIRNELNTMAANDEIDAFLLVPADITTADAKYEFLSRKGGDFVANDLLKDAVNEAVRSQRLADAHVNEVQLRELSRNVDLDSKAINERGEEKDSGSLFVASLVIGMMIYISLAIYGQVILGAVVEEKDTRIAEILFSSARPFELMLGKLVGVGLAGLTQLTIWIVTLGTVVGFLSVQSGTAEIFSSVPRITPLMVALFLLYFLVGYFLFASMYEVIGSMVTTVQEGGQFALPVTMVLLIGFYFSFAVMRDPNSNLSFWVSISPFFAPMTMPVRILAEMPPLWQIALSIGLNAIVIAGLVWLAARVYRVGMLMYGKRATIPEVLKWIRQA